MSIQETTKKLIFSLLMGMFGLDFGEKGMNDFYVFLFKEIITENFAGIVGFPKTIMTYSDILKLYIYLQRTKIYARFNKRTKYHNT